MRRFSSSGLFQKLKDINYKNVIYVLLIYASIILSLVFGQINNANNGAFGNGMNEWQTILFYFFILTLYGVSFFIAYRNKIIQFNKKTIITIGIMGAVLIYFVFLNLFSDFSYILTEMGYQNKDPITVLMRIQGILDVSLSLLMTYSFLFLIPQIYPKSSHVKLVSYFVIFFTLVASIYSLATEINTYKTMLESFDFISKERGIGCLSFFTYANVFGHLHLFCIIAIFLLSIVHKKKWIMIFSLINVLLVYFSGCRGALLSALFFYLFSIIYLIIVRFKDKKFVRATITTTFISAFILFIVLESTVFNNIEIEGYTFKDIVGKIFYYIGGERVGTFKYFFEHGSINNIIFGYGYNLNDYINRTISENYNAHNSFVELYTTGGVFLAIVYIILLIVLIRRVILIAKNGKLEISLFFFVTLFTYTIHSLSEGYPLLFNYFGGGLMGAFLVLVPSIYYHDIKGNVLDIIHLFKKADEEQLDIYNRYFKI